jgi:hypothetical protein
MSERLYLRGGCELLFERTGPGSIIVGESVKNYSFSVSKSGQDVKIKLLQDGKTIEFESVVDSFKSNILQILRTDDYDKLSEGEKTELRGITSPINEAVRQFIGLLKQELHRYDIREELIGNSRYEWSLGDNQWHSIPRGLTIDSWISSLGNLYEKSANHLQKLLSEDEEALVATSYLHHARNLMNRRYTWIYATIAAELAIKEILVRIEPRFRVILEELPSPPLNKLYGEVLQSVAGVKLPGSDLEKLRKGARRRNELIHNPKSATPTFKEVTEYIDFIEDKIKWILEEWRSMK